VLVYGSNRPPPAESATSCGWRGRARNCTTEGYSKLPGLQPAVVNWSLVTYLRCDQGCHFPRELPPRLLIELEDAEVTPPPPRSARSGPSTRHAHIAAPRSPDAAVRLRANGS
jgi:hypothetical protein